MKPWTLVKGEKPCPWCDKAADLLVEQGIPFVTITLPSATLRAFAAAFEVSTVPQVFDSQEDLIGGYTELSQFFTHKRAAEKLAINAAMALPDIKIERVSPLATLPTYGSADAAGLDLYAALPVGEVIELWPHQKAIIPTGIAMEIPAGYYGRIAPRSGLGAKGLDVLAGVIDCDYRGEVKVILANVAGEGPVKIGYRDRIAQLVLEKNTRARVLEGTLRTVTARGAGGFGSTGA